MCGERVLRRPVVVAFKSSQVKSSQVKSAWTDAWPESRAGAARRARRRRRRRREAGYFTGSGTGIKRCEHKS